MTAYREPKARVVQIMPAAPGWRAVWASLDDGTPFADQIVCWALVDYSEDDDAVYWPAVTGARQAICGMYTGSDGWIDSPEGGDNFLGYLAPGESADIWAELARSKYERARNRREAKP